VFAMTLQTKEWRKEVLDKLIEQIESGKDDQETRRFYFQQIELYQEDDFQGAEDYLRRYMEIYHKGLRKQGGD
jgi:hypothetical protein